MSDDFTAPEIGQKKVSETEILSVDYTEVLNTGTTNELLASVTSVTEVTTSDLTIANAAVNAAPIDINDIEVAIGKAVQFSVVGGVANTRYKIKIVIATDSTPARALIRYINLDVVED